MTSCVWYFRISSPTSGGNCLLSATTSLSLDTLPDRYNKCYLTLSLSAVGESTHNFFQKACGWERPYVKKIENFAIPLQMSCEQIPLTMYPLKKQCYALSRTYGVSIFIDYCTAPRDTEKGGRRGKRHSTDKRE